MRWAETSSATARTGLGFTENLYERERFEEVLAVAADIRSHVVGGFHPEEQVQEWLDRVGSGVAGYVTPKITVGAVVGNDAGELLMVQRADSGFWLYPTGWADVGYSPAEVVVKEVHEETGIECEVVRPIAILDGQRRGYRGSPGLAGVPLPRHRRRAATAPVGVPRRRLVRRGRPAGADGERRSVGRTGIPGDPRRRCPGPFRPSPNPTVARARRRLRSS
ncbi:MAG: NUDIX hydrolase N-terminal domain-containing protein [Acidimicrobiales bacterium]